MLSQEHGENNKLAYSSEMDAVMWDSLQSISGLEI